MRVLCAAICLLLTLTTATGSTEQETVTVRPRNPLADVPKEFHFLFGSGIGSNQLAATWAALPYDSISLERDTCLGTCPAYKVTLFRGRPKDTDKESYEDRFGRAELIVTKAGSGSNYRKKFPEER